MQILKTTLATATIAATATTAFAGGLSPEIIEAPVVAEEVMAPAPSINPTYIVVGVLAALLIAAAVAEDDEDDDEPRRDTIDTIDTINVSR